MNAVLALMVVLSLFASGCSTSQTEPTPLVESSESPGTVASPGSLPNAAVVATLAPAVATPGGPELPRVLLKTSLFETPSKGKVIPVKAGGNLQAALDSAKPGDIVELEAGAIFTGKFWLKNTSDSKDWITIRTSAYRELPYEGMRVGPQHAALMPKLQIGIREPVLNTQGAAHHFRIIGIEMTYSPAVKGNSSGTLVALGSSTQKALDQIPHDIIIDRSYIHGGPEVGFQRCLALNSASTAIIDSYLSECHGKGFDAQAIGGWNGPGPYKIVNNYLEGSAENIMFGGAKTTVPDLVPSDIEFRENYVVKPRSWILSDGSSKWSVKTLFELKFARRVLVDSNIFENCWSDAQTGFGMNIKTSGDQPHVVTEHLTFTNNIIKGVEGGAAIAALQGAVSLKANSILFRNNFIDASRQPWKISSGVDHLWILHNTTVNSTKNAMEAYTDNLAQVGPAVDLKYQDNVSQFGAYGVNVGQGSLKFAQIYPGSFLFDHNLFFGGNAAFYKPANMVGNTYVKSMEGIGFVSPSTGDYTIQTQSPFYGTGSDGKSPGADMNVMRSIQFRVTGK